MRLFIILIAIALVFFIIRKSLQQLISTGQKPAAKIQESMVPCDYCNVHIPASEAIHKGDKRFCTREHLDAWLEQNKNP